MKNKLISLIFVILLVLSTSVSAYVLSGTIKDSDTTLGIVGASVNVEDTVGNPIGSTTTDGSGVYSLDVGSVETVYAATATKTGYTTSTKYFFNDANQELNFAIKSTSAPTCTDVDGDTYGAEGTDLTSCLGSTTIPDCNDNNININPGKTEVCNGVDDNCVGGIDEGVKTSYYLDNDGDNYGNNLNILLACSAPINYVLDNTDCNDNNININPGSTDNCLDCNALTLCASCVDVDLDNYGAVGTDLSSCTGSTTLFDCNDNNNAINPGASEVCGNGIDENCDGVGDACPAPSSSSSGSGSGSSSGDSCTINLRELENKKTIETRSGCIIYFSYNNLNYQTKVESVSTSSLTLSLLEKQATSLLNNQARLSLTSTKDLIFSYDDLDFGKVTISFEVGDKLKEVPKEVITTSSTSEINTNTEPKTSSTPTGAAITEFDFKKPAIGIGIIIGIIIIGLVVRYFLFLRD